MEETRRVISMAQIGNMNKGESSGNPKVYCYYYQKDGHYNNQCLVKANEKQPAVNMVIVEVTDVQQVTTQSKGKADEWETQETIRKQATVMWLKYRTKTHSRRSPSSILRTTQLGRHYKSSRSCYD